VSGDRIAQIGLCQKEIVNRQIERASGKRDELRTAKIDRQGAVSIAGDLADL
jgi:hypothetical protein